MLIVLQEVKLAQYRGEKAAFLLLTVKKGCFETLEEFAAGCVPPSLDASKTDARKEECRKLAWDAARGSILCAVHNKFNYAHY